MKNSIKKNFLLTSLYQLIYVLTPLLTTPYISRVLGADGIGDYSFAFSVATYFTLFIRLGLNIYGNRTIAAVRDDKSQLSKTFCEIYTMQILCGVIFTGLYVLWTVLFAPRAILSFCLIFFVLSAVIDITWLLCGVEDFTITTIRDICVRLSTVALIFFFVKNTDDLWKYTLIQGFGYIGGQLLAWLRVKRHIVFVLPRITAVLIHLKPNLILFIPSIAVSFYKTMDKIMLGAMAASNELGYYESSERVINVPMALITALGTVMLPRMSNMIATNAEKERVNKLIEKSVIFAAFISSLLCFGIMTVADQFVPIFYGKGYEKCVTVYAWLLPSCVFLAFANVLRTQVLIPQKRDKEYIASLMTGAVVNLVLNAVLIPFYASIGAAIATLAAEGSVWLVQSIEVRKEQQIGKYIVETLPFVLSGLVMYFMFRKNMFLIGSRLISLGIKVVVCGISYFTVLGVLIGLQSLFRRLIKAW